MIARPLLAGLLLAAAAAPAPGAEGWSLRGAANSSPVALLDGPGNLQNLALFCLAGQPFLALVFRKPPEAARLKLDFAFSAAGTLRLDAEREPTAGDAYVAPLRDEPLARALAGQDASVRLGIEGRPIGTLSLAGSTAAIRAALGSCLPS